MPLRSWATTDELTSPNTIKANNMWRSFASPDDMGARKRPLLAQGRSTAVGLVEILGGRQVGLARQTPKILLRSSSRGNTLLAASGFNDVSSHGNADVSRKLGGA